MQLIVIAPLSRLGGKVTLMVLALIAVEKFKYILSSLTFHPQINIHWEGKHQLQINNHFGSLETRRRINNFKKSYRFE